MLPTSFSGILHRIAAWIVLAFLCSAIIRFTLLLDLNKRVYNHTPGPCRVISNLLNGSAGMELVRGTDLVFISYGLAKLYGIETHDTGIAVFQMGKESKYETKKLKIEGENFDERQFIPYGLSSYQSKGRISLYVVNSHANRQCIELFYYNKDKNILIHRKAVCDQRFSSLVDVAVVGADRFFVTNIAYFGKGKMQLLEFTMQSSFGSLFYYDGHNVMQIESRLLTPSAISVDHKRNLIYIASLLNENIRVYALQKDLSLVYRTEIALLSSPTGIHIDEESGDLWISLHPVIYLAYLHSLNPTDDKLHSPSQILRVRIQEDGVSWVITEPYANDGATITASSDVVYYKEQLLIGSLFGRLVHCDVLNPSIT